MSIPSVYHREEPGFLDRIVEKSEDPTISTIAFAVLGLAVIYYFAPITAIVLATSCIGLTIGAVAFSILFGSDDEAISTSSIVQPGNDLSDTDWGFQATSPQPSYVDDPDYDIDDKPLRRNRTPGETLRFQGVSHEIRIGLPNTGNTCWLNACLNLIASSEYFDTMLNTPTYQPQDSLRVALLNVITEMRKKRSGVLDLALYEDLKKEIALHMAKHTCNGRQRDAAEFMRDLAVKLNWKPNDSCRGMIVYSSNSGSGTKRPQKMDDCWYLPIKFETNKELRRRAPLDSLATRPEVVNVISDDTNVDTQFTASPRFSHLPNDLMVHVDRAAWNNQQQRFKVETLLKTETNGLIQLIEENLVNGVLKPKRIVHYQIHSAIVHYGDTEAGHYVCHTRSKTDDDDENMLVCHDDERLYGINQEKDFGTHGYFIHLRKCSEQIIND